MHREAHECPSYRPTSARTTMRATLVDELGVGAEIAIVCTKGGPARSCGLALRVGREDTLACPAGEVVTLNAIRVILRRSRAHSGQEDNCRCHEGKKYYAHVSLLRFRRHS